MSGPGNHPHTFEVGERVVATGYIWRHDKRTVLRPGDRATVSAVYKWQRHQGRPQIISLEVGDKLPIRDLVCFEQLPLRVTKGGSRGI